MKSQALRYARIVLSSLLLFFTCQVLQARETGVPSSPLNTAAVNPPEPDQQLLVSLMVVLPGNVEGLADGFRLRFNTGYLRSIVDDAVKMNNFSENLSSYRESTDLIVERRPLIVSYDTIFLRLTNTTIRDYRLKIYAKSFGPNMLAYIEDAWLHKYRVFELNGDTTRFNFSVTSDPASQASNRFRIIFAAFGTLPIQFTGISAVAVNNKVKLQWTAADDQEIKQYEIERSTNGLDFSVLGTVNSGSSNGYAWVDQNPCNGINYYRVHGIGRSGEMVYSKLVKAAVNNAPGGMLVYPNPVAGHILHLNLSGKKPAIYTLQLVNGQGQAVMQAPVKHSGGTIPYTIAISTAILPGRYILVLQQPGESPVQESLVIL